MARLSRSTMRALGPVVIPLMTKVAIPIALESLRRRKLAVDEYADEEKEVFQKNLKRTRSDIDDVKQEAIARGTRLYAEARKEGTELLDLLARRGLQIANEWAGSLGQPRVPRRRFRWGHAVGLAVLVAAGLAIVSRR
ncbi:MAG: hypothetical protein ABR576_01325 [Thermoanaerobaculia bacterium]